MKEKILSILSDIRPEVDYASSNDFIGDGLIDSFDMTSLVVGLDNLFNITIDEEDIEPENFVNIDSIIKLVSKYK